MESSRFPMFKKIHFYYVSIHSLRTIERNADRDIRVNYDVIFYDKWLYTNYINNILIWAKKPHKMITINLKLSTLCDLSIGDIQNSIHYRSIYNIWFLAENTYTVIPSNLKVSTIYEF